MSSAAGVVGRLAVRSEMGRDDMTHIQVNCAQYLNDPVVRSSLSLSLPLPHTTHPRHVIAANEARQLNLAWCMRGTPAVLCVIVRWPN